MRSVSTMLARVLSYENRSPAGEIYNMDYDQKFSFQGLDQMLLIMDDLMDAAAFPQPEFRLRHFGRGSYVFYESGRGGAVQPVVVSGEKAQMRRERTVWPPAGKGSGELVRFQICVYYRQHGSMQGELWIRRSRP